MAGEDITIMVFSIFFGFIVTVAIIANVSNAIKKRRKRKEKLTQETQEDNYYELACNGIYDMTLAFILVGDTMYCRKDKIAFIDKDDDGKEWFAINLKFSYNVYRIKSDDFFKKLDSVDGMDISGEDSNITAYAVRFVMCKNIMLTAIANNEQYDNCIILVPDRKKKSLDILIKKNGKLRHAYSFDCMNYLELDSFPLYYMLAYDSFRNDFKFGHISLYTGIASIIYPDHFAHKFRIMTGFNPEFHRTYDYDY